MVVRGLPTPGMRLGWSLSFAVSPVPSTALTALTSASSGAGGEAVPVLVDAEERVVS